MHAGTAVDGDVIYVAGGYVGKAEGGQIFATREVWKYNVATSTWTPMPQLPAARGGGQLVRLGRVLHYFGGSDLNRADRAEHWQLALDGGTAWASAAPLPAALNHHGAAVLDGKIYSVGGQKGQDSSAVAQISVYVWNLSSPGSWAAVKSLPKARSHIMASSFTINRRLVVAGGDSVPNTALSDVTAYDRDRDLDEPYSLAGSAHGGGWSACRPRHRVHIGLRPKNDLQGRDELTVKIVKLRRNCL